MMGVDFLLLLLFKVAVTAFVVVAISIAIEQSGPVLGGVLMGLPITGGPGYVFLALQSSPEFVAQSALASFAIVAANMAYVVAYIVAVRRFGRLVTTGIGLLAWFICASLIEAGPVTLWTGIAWNAAGLAVSIPLICMRRPETTKALRRASRRELLLRALSAGLLVAAVVTASDALGSSMTGIGILAPVTLVTIGWIMRSSYGPAEAISVMTGALIALPGFALAVLSLHVLVVPAGPGPALAMFFLVAVAWGDAVVPTSTRGSGSNDRAAAMGLITRRGTPACASR